MIGAKRRTCSHFQLPYFIKHLILKIWHCFYLKKINVNYVRAIQSAISLMKNTPFTKKKTEARNEKRKDKNEETYVFTVDLQAVLMAPKSHVNSLYYRTKLQVHNLVFYNLRNQRGFCFLWDEVEGGLHAEEFASIWVYFVEKKFLVKIIIP